MSESKEESTAKLMRLKENLAESELELKEVESMYVSNKKELNWKIKSTGKRQIELRNLETGQDHSLKEKRVSELKKLERLIKKLMTLKKNLSGVKTKLEIAKNSQAKQNQQNLELRWKLRKQKEKNLKLKVDLSNKYTQSKINFNSDNV